MTSDESLNLRIPKFDGKNFGLWKKHVTLVFKSKNLIATIDANSIKVESVEDVGQQNAFTEHKDNQALALMIGAMEPEVVQKVISCETALEAWQRLHAIYENTSPAAVGKILEQYYSYRKSPSDDMATHVSKVEAMAIQLAEIGEKQSEVSIMAKLLHSLPESFSGLKEAWDSVHPSLQTRGNLVARMLAGDVSRESQNTGNKDTALVMSKNAKDHKSKNDRRKQVKCYLCNRMGHYKSQCPQNPDAQQSGGRRNVALVMDGLSNRENWIVDSGASKHTCCRRDWFQTLDPIEEKLSVGNQESVTALGKGKITIVCQVGKNREEVDLHDVLYIPQMAFNLFSTGKASERGATTVIDKTGCKITFGGRVLATGSMDPSNGLCVLSATTKAGVAMLVSTRRTLDEWHKSLGHVDPQVVKEMAENQLVDGMELVNPPAAACCECPVGKASRAPHTKVASFVPRDVGDRVVMDLVGPMSADSLGGSKYILLAKDSFSNFSHIYMLKSKDETASLIQKYIGEFEAQSGRKIRSMLSDNGSEFCNKKISTLLAVEHIHQVTSAAYVPEQNGQAERNNKTIIETIRTMMATSGLPDKLWAEAAATAVYLRNRTPKRGSKKTPYEVFFGRKPFIGHLVPFGTRVQSLINDRRLAKFDARTEPAVVVGFTDRSNTYRVYLPDQDRVKISCDVVFRDHAKYESPVKPREDAEVVVSLQKPGGANPTSQQDRGVSVVQLKDPQVIQEGDEDDRDITSPSFSTFSARGDSVIRDVSMDQRDSQAAPMAASELEPQLEQGPVPQPRRLYPDLEQVEDPFRGNAIPRERPAQGRSNNRAVLLAHSQLSEPVANIEPRTYEEAVQGPNKLSWLKAIESELDAHKKCGTFKITKRPSTGVLLSAKWVFKVKRNDHGDIERFKARLVARGFQQREGLDFHETFAPVAKMESIRVLLALAASKGFEIERFDVSTAFLNGTIEEQVYVEPPPGIKVKEGECLQLRKALYGCKQSPRIWNSHFDAAVQKLGFKPLVCDSCVYVDFAQGRYLAIYVDDGLIVGKTKQACLEVIESLNKSFKTNRVVGDVFLGIQISKTSDGFYLSQPRYIADVLSRFKMADSQPLSTPLADTNILFDKNDDEPVQAPYRSAIGSLVYLAMATRPDILFPTVLLSRFNNCPKRVHWEAVKRVMRYLKGTADVGLLYTGKYSNVVIKVYSDADYAGDKLERKSTSGILVKLNGCPIIFRSRQQEGVSGSSTEAEYVAAAEATDELKWLCMFLSELKIQYEKPALFVDNMSAIQNIKNNDVSRGSKHIDIKYHRVRYQHRQGLFNLLHVGTKEQLADYLTKRIGREQLETLLSKSNVVAQNDKVKYKSADCFDRGGVLGLTLSQPASGNMLGPVGLKGGVPNRHVRETAREQNRTV